jgi:hypothetical protein
LRGIGPLLLVEVALADSNREPTAPAQADERQKDTRNAQCPTELPNEKRRQHGKP